MAHITADQLADLLQALVVISVCTGAAAVLLGYWFHGIACGVAQWFEKRSKPPSPAVLKAIATCMRARALVLEKRAEKALRNFAN